MRLMIRTSLALAALLAPLAIAHAAPAQPYRLAVVELRNTAGLRDEEVMYLTDQARTQASKALPGERFLVMTRESIVALLPPGKTLADCAKGQCEVEVGRTIGADYIVTGEVLRFGDELRMNLKVHACVSGAFLGSEAAKGAKVNDLESGLSAACGVLFAKVRTHAAMGVGSGSGGAVAGVEGRIGQAPPVWTPDAKKKRVVRITSDPPGAVVQLDGQLLCASTPCSREVVPGVVQLQMQKERYESRTEVVPIPDDGTTPDISWTLAPLFGWLTVSTIPSGLPVTVNGEAVGVSPVVRRESDPGLVEVRVSDARYHESGERVSVAMGAERVVTIVASPREGAIEVSAVDPQGNAIAGTLRVDGQRIGDVPGTYKLLIGRHVVSVANGSAEWVGNVDVVEQQVLPVFARVVPRPRQERHKAESKADEDDTPWSGRWIGVYGQAWYNSETFHKGFDNARVVNDPFTSPVWFGVVFSQDSGDSRLAIEYEHYRMSNVAHDVFYGDAIRRDIACDAIGANLMWFWGRRSLVRLGAGGGAMMGLLRCSAGVVGQSGLKSTGVITALDIKVALHLKLGASALVFAEAVPRTATANVESIGGSDRHGLVQESDRIGLALKW